MIQIVSSFSKDESSYDQLAISEELIADIERIFLSPDAIDPCSDLMKKISRPSSFPKDQTGEEQGLQRISTCHGLFTGNLCLKKAIFKEVDMNPDGQLAWITRKIFTGFVLPVGLRNGTWTPAEDKATSWIKNLIADIQIARTIRLVLREESAKSMLFDGSSKFLFEGN